VNTCVWGPPLWRILHTISFAPESQVRHAHEHIIRFLNVLGEVLPCKWCRISYKQFIQDDLPPLAETIQSNGLARWMFDLHALVNRKLGAHTPKFESIVKRFEVRPIQWSASDVWDTISLLGLNFTPEKQNAYATFWNSWPYMLRLGWGVDSRVADLLANTPCPCENGAFIATCLVLEAAFLHRPSPSREMVHERTRRYMVAIAQGGCSQGVCE